MDILCNKYVYVTFQNPEADLFRVLENSPAACSCFHINLMSADLFLHFYQQSYDK